MRNPMTWGLIYFAVGCIFTYLAASSPGSMWSFYSILLMVFAAYNISISFKMFAFSFKVKKIKIKKSHFSSLRNGFFMLIRPDRIHCWSAFSDTPLLKSGY